MMESGAAHPSWYELAVAARIRFLANLAKAPPAELDSSAGVTTVVDQDRRRGVGTALLQAALSEGSAAAATGGHP